jgi:hypothetical protein
MNRKPNMLSETGAPGMMIENKPCTGPVCQKDKGRIGPSIPGVNAWIYSSLSCFFFRKNRFTRILTCQNSGPVPIRFLGTYCRPFTGSSANRDALAAFSGSGGILRRRISRPLEIGGLGKMIKNKPCTGPVSQKGKGRIGQGIPGVNTRIYSSLSCFFFRKNRFKRILTCQNSGPVPIRFLGTYCRPFTGSSANRDALAAFSGSGGWFYVEES